MLNAKSSTICGEHFPVDSFVVHEVAESLGFSPRFDQRLPVNLSNNIHDNYPRSNVINMIPKLILLGVTVCLDVHIYLDPVYKK